MIAMFPVAMLPPEPWRQLAPSVRSPPWPPWQSTGLHGLIMGSSGRNIMENHSDFMWILMEFARMFFLW